MDDEMVYSAEGNIGKPTVQKVNVREKINAFQKLKFESEFQALSPGGYFHVPE